MQWSNTKHRTFDWWALYLRALAVLFGVSVLIVGTHQMLSTPTAFLLLLLLLPSGYLSVLEAPRSPGPHVASWTGTLLELGIVSFLVYETGRLSSFFYFFYVPVLIWGTAGRGLIAGVVGGWVAALGFAVVTTLGNTSSMEFLPRAALLMLMGVLVGMMEQRRMEATDSALRGAKELHRRARVTAEIQATLMEMTGQGLPERARRFLARAIRLSGADRGLVAILDVDGRPMVQAAVEPAGERPHQEALPRTAVLDEIFRSALPQSVVDAGADARWVSVFGKDVGGTAVLLPLCVGGRAFGALCLARRDVRLFADDELGAVRALTEMAASSLRDAQIHVQSREFMLSTVNALTAALEAKDPYTRGHSQRVAGSAVAIATELGLPAEEVERVQWASLLHDIGKIGTPEAILRKRGPLTDEERVIMDLHPERGATILSQMEPFRPFVDYVRHHQEAYDGSGYPVGLAGDAIPLGARLIHVADTFDALTSDRSYRRGRSVEDAMAELRGMAGTLLDPAVVEVFLRVLKVKPPFEVQLRLWRER